MKSFFFGFVSLGALGLVLIPACGNGGDAAPNLTDLGGGDGGPVAARGVGDRCDDGGKCRTGLTCEGGVCKAAHALDIGASCTIGDECKDGQYCGPERKCAQAGTGGPGVACGSDGDCKSGFRCNIIGFGAECNPEGTKDVGGACALSGDCLAGLLCASKVCVAPQPGVPALAIPGWKGVACEKDTGPVTAYFHVPKAGDTTDFFRLPFPNDIRRKADGKLDLTNFPVPGSDLLGYDLVDRWARFLEQTGTGWSEYPTITFRFSTEIDFNSLNTKNATKLVDLTNGDEPAHTWAGTTAGSQYVCPNSVSFRPPNGLPLKSGHTYAAIITNLARGKDGGSITVSPELTPLLGANDPGGDAAAGYKAYAPLRTWAASKSFPLDTIVNVSVFTVGKHDEIAKKLAPAVAAAPAPTIVSAWVKCGSGASPCGQATDSRACPATPDPSFDELHAVVKIPLFQKGTAPFVEVADGGDFVLDAAGQPQPQGSVDVCVALTVPTSAAPAGGWPVVVYAHGTGGSFRSHINEGVATRLANVEGSHIAVLGFDQVGHGTRRGSSTADPKNLFFNFANPAAARGNVLQGAADQMSFVRFAKSLDVAAGTSPTGKAIKLDKIAFWGHSQGATEGTIAMPYTDDVVAALFSGAGGSLIDALLGKKSPVNLAAVAPAVLSELPSNINITHPALAMFQNGIDPADPLDHALAISTVPKHVFVPYGQHDTFAPAATQYAYTTAAGLFVAQPPASVTAPDKLGRDPVPIPVTANSQGDKITAVVRQYAPKDYDGHFVVFKDADAMKDADRFLVDALTGVTPKIGR